MKFMQSPTLYTLTDIDKENTNNEALIQKITEDMRLPETIHFLEHHPTACDQSPNAILLTGATGYLGVFLLKSLLQTYTASIYCLVRGQSAQSALKRLQQQAEKYSLLDLIDWPRVIVLTGEITQPMLGLSDANWHELATDIDVIYHCAAYVHHIYDYTKLRDANVLSTLSLLELACTTKNKAFNYISTCSSASIFDASGKAPEVGPTYLFSEFNQFNGYVSSKYVSEVLTWKARERGMQVAIFRPGNVAADSITGACNPEQNHMLLLVKSCIQLGYAPDWDFQYDFYPVNLMADMIAYTAKSQHVTPAPIYHLTNPNSPTWQTLIQWLNQLGYSIKLVSPDQWLDKLKSIGPDNALFSLVGFYLNRQEAMHGAECFHTYHTNSILHSAGLTQPVITDETITKLCLYLKKIGFLS